MNRANPIYFSYRLPDDMYLVACWSWHRRYLAGELPDRWEVLPRDQSSGLMEQCRQSGYRPLHTTESRKQSVWDQIRQSQQQPKRTPKQQAKYEARQARKREQDEAHAQWQQKLGKLRMGFEQAFSGLSADDVRRKYRQLAREHHPDTGGNAESFHQLEAAYRAAIKAKRH